MWEHKSEREKGNTGRVKRDKEEAEEEGRGRKQQKKKVKEIMKRNKNAWRGRWHARRINRTRDTEKKGAGI